ncbi:MAG: hypothetical protein QXS93_03360 [Candidatus Micrarchaeia archaeon]
MQDISDIISDASKVLLEEESSYLMVKEKCEEIIRVCGRAMQLMHAGRADDANKMLEGIKPQVLGMQGSSNSLVLVAQQEYAEAQLLLHMLGNQPLPHYKDLGVPPEAYLLGLLDALGEARREIIEHMRKDDYETATRLFEVMSSTYELLLPLRFSNSILPGFRRKLDVARSLVEQCRRDLLMFKISKGL